MCTFLKSHAIFYTKKKRQKAFSNIILEWETSKWKSESHKEKFQRIWGWQSCTWCPFSNESSGLVTGSVSAALPFGKDVTTYCRASAQATPQSYSTDEKGRKGSWVICPKLQRESTREKEMGTQSSTSFLSSDHLLIKSMAITRNTNANKTHGSVAPPASGKA